MPPPSIVTIICYLNYLQWA